MLTNTAETVLQRRYYLKDSEGNCIEDWDKLCRRVARAVASVEPSKEKQEIWEAAFYKHIYELDFLPNSPCLMNAGTNLGQLSACFVLPVEDSMEGIFTAIRNGALVHKSGGGTGYSFSRLRPKNSNVQSTQGVASGPLSFMQVFDAATEVIKQGGKRRGANMGVLRVDHPDILDFIEAKKDQTKLTNFNLSVACTDTFMNAVVKDTTYDLIHPCTKEVVNTLSAKEVYNKIIDLAWHNGEPGIIFIDTANNSNPTPELGEFEATNPCGEQFLLPYESCNLGSINLAKCVVNGKIDWDYLNSLVHVVVRFLDNVIDCNKYPIPEIAEMTLKTRKLGLGIMGLHDMLIQCHEAYNSVEGRSLAAKVMRHIKQAALEASHQLGIEKGFIANGRYRNAALTSIQPTGTVSMIADCASGCEPYFSIVTTKHVMDDDHFIMVNPLFERIAKEEGFYSEELMRKIAATGTVVGHPEILIKWQRIFRTAQDISPIDHIDMQAVLQANGVDSAISKTINLPNSATKESIAQLYIYAWSQKCKGLTIYRDGSRDNQVLTTGTTTIEPSEKNNTSKATLPDVLDARRYKLKYSDDQAMYVIICFDENENPKEVFTKFPFDNRIDLNEKSTMWTTTCRLVSLALRCHVPIEEIIKQLDRSSGSMYDLPAQLGKLLKSFMAKTQQGFFSECPECKNGSLSYEEGCEICKECGYSKCS